MLQRVGVIHAVTKIASFIFALLSIFLLTLLCSKRKRPRNASRGPLCARARLAENPVPVKGPCLPEDDQKRRSLLGALLSLLWVKGT